MIRSPSYPSATERHARYTSCSSSRSVNGCGEGASARSKSGSAPSLMRSAAESIRTPATPRSSQKRSTSSCSFRTSSLSQLRSGCSGANRWRYHSPGRPVGVPRPRPRTAAEDGRPVVRRQLAAGAAARAEPEAFALGRARLGGERIAEPRVLVRTVVRDDVDDHAEPELGGLIDQQLGLGERPEHRVDVAVVGDVVAAVGHRRRVPRREPDRVHAEVAQVREPRAHAGEVADAVAVAVGEATARRPRR